MAAGGEVVDRAHQPVSTPRNDVGDAGSDRE